MQFFNLTHRIRLYISKLNRVFALAVLSAIFLCCGTAWAQTYPTFTADSGISGTAITEGYAPTMAVLPSNNTLYLAYANKSNGYLTIVTSTNGTSYSTPYSTGIYIGTATSPSLTIFNNELFLAYSSGSQAYITSSPDGVTWTTPTAVSLCDTPIASIGRMKPAIYGHDGYLYLAYDVSYYGAYQVEISYSQDGVDFQGNPCILSATSQSYPATSDPSITSFTNQYSQDVLALAWTTTGSQVTVATDYPVTSANGFTTATSATAPMSAANDVAITQLNGALFVFGQSYYTSEDNLWAVASSDGISFEAEHEYGQTLSGGPALAVINNVICQTGRSKYNDQIWQNNGTL